MSTEQETSGSTPLFAVFLLSIISIFLIPYTLYVVFGDEEDDKEVVKTWSSKKDKQKAGVFQKLSARLRHAFTPKLLAAWLAYFLLLWYVQAASKPMERFDPFEILQIPESASDADIKRAYRKLSLQYHPDKNPDPAAAEYFAQHVAKAYKALTDKVARENYKKYGHPDGPQAVSISVALPEWFFNKDKEAAPAILLTLLLGGIVGPLGLAACYLRRSRNSTGPNEIMIETVQWYLYSPFAIKQFQGVGRLPETLVCAMEFINLPITAEQGPALDTLRRSLIPHFPELKDTSGAFYKKRNQALVKAHILLLAHLVREEVPPVLKKDQLFILQKAPRLLQEMFSISTAPRVKPGYGWLAPAVGTVELMQCLIQGVSIEEKKKHAAPVKSAESSAAILQLPHVDDDVVRKLQKRKLRTLADLQAMDRSERRIAMQSCGLAGNEVDDVETALSALPCIYLTASLAVDDGDSTDQDVLAETDVITCSAHVMLIRSSHQAAGFDPESIKGTAARAYAPNYPFPRDEHWIFMVADPSNNTVLCWQRVPLLEAEAVGAKYAGSWANGVMARGIVGNDEEGEEELVERVGQRVDLKFIAPPAGKHDLLLYAMPDSWLGADRAVQLKLRTVEPSRAQREGRIAAANGGSSKSSKSKSGRASAGSTAAAAAGAAADGGLDRSEESELMLGDEDAPKNRAGSEDEVGLGSGSGSEDEEESDEGEQEWDSDEYGTEESGDEGEETASDEE